MVGLEGLCAEVGNDKSVVGQATPCTFYMEGSSRTSGSPALSFGVAAVCLAFMDFRHPTVGFGTTTRPSKVVLACPATTEGLMHAVGSATMAIVPVGRSTGIGNEMSRKHGTKGCHLVAYDTLEHAFVYD